MMEERRRVKEKKQQKLYVRYQRVVQGDEKKVVAEKKFYKKG
jgi:hypothetical protein